MTTSDDTLAGLLDCIGANKITRAGPGYSIAAEKGVRVAVHRQRITGHRALTQTLTLTNTTKATSAPINALKILDLVLTTTMRDDPYAISFGIMGGMGNTGSYPPAAYRLNEISFGAKATGDVTMSATRWWSGHRYHEITSGLEGGHGTAGSLPILFFAWSEGRRQRGVWIALEWSGRWKIALESGEDGCFTITATIPVQDMTLAARETLELPTVHLGYYDGGREQGFNAIRRYIMDSLIPCVNGKKPQALLAYDHWMGIHGELTEKNMLPQVDAAAALGLDYFVVDAGWFGGMERGWVNAVGNWQRIHPEKFPNGLSPLAKHVRDKGMRFGMWFEPERAAADSDWPKKYPLGYLRNNAGGYHLDFSQPAMQEAVIEMLSGHIRELDIRWLRWDYNQTPGSFWDAKDPTGKIQFACIRGLYRVWDTLLQRFPGLLLELGWRMDFGSMRRSVSTIMADYAEDPHLVRCMQTSAARAIPATYLNGFTYQGSADALILSPLQLISRMAGSFTLGGCIDRYSSKQRALVRRYLNGYKAFRHLLTCDFHALTPAPLRPDEADVVEFAASGGAEAVILAFQVRGGKRRLQLRPKGLTPAARYRISDPFTTKVLGTATGKTLMHTGLALTLADDSAIVRHLHRM